MSIFGIVKPEQMNFSVAMYPFPGRKNNGTVMPLNRREVLCCNVQLGAYSELEILSRMVKKI